MSQTAPLINTLKQALKSHGKTYADVAAALDLHQASVKRLFAEKNLSLQRLDQICQLMGMEITDLVKLMGESQRQLTELSEEQEKEIAEDLVLLLITVCVLNRWSLEDIINHYALSEVQCVQKLAKLDRLKIVELQPSNHIKLLVAANFSWRNNGPIQRFFHESVERDFFNTHFNRDTDKLLVVNGMLSCNSNTQFQRKMVKLVQEFDVLNTEDTDLPIDQRFGTTAVIAVRQWQYGLFEDLLKKE